MHSRSTSSSTSSSSSSYSSYSSYKSSPSSHTSNVSQWSSEFSDWEEGDIAFLKPWLQISNELENVPFEAFRRAIKNQRGACGHPVIILKASSDRSHYAVTTVSAYSSSRDNGYLAPWNQPHHQRKQRKDFRSFHGSEQANRRSTLRLEGDKLMPKPKLSWVYIQSVFVVPAKTLKVFTKSHDQLRLTQESLADLWAHMGQETRGFEQTVRTLTAAIERLPIVAQPERSSRELWNLSNDSLPQGTVPASPSAGTEDKPATRPMTWARIAASTHTAEVSRERPLPNLPPFKSGQVCGGQARKLRS